jgi:transposase
LRCLARKTKDANQSRRLLALAEIYDGGSRSDAARIGGVGLQIVHDWVVRFNSRGPDALINGKAPGKQPKLNDAQRQALVAIVENGPLPGCCQTNSNSSLQGQSDCPLCRTETAPFSKSSGTVEFEIHSS